MEKCKLSAKQAQEVTKTTGKEWLLNTIFKTIRQAAERGENKIIWDFAPNFEVASDVKNTLYDMGYMISENEDIDDFACEISWEDESLADFIGGVSERWNDFSQAEKEDFATTISSAEKLSHIVKRQGRIFLITGARRMIMQSAYKGRSSLMLELDDVPDYNIKWLIDNLNKDGFKVEYLKDIPALKVSI